MSGGNPGDGDNTTDEGNNDKQLNTAEIIGIAVGALLGLALIIAVPTIICVL